MKLKYYFLLSCSILFFLTSCSDDEDAVLPVLNSSGLEKNELELKLGESLSISPKINTDDLDYQWLVNDEAVSNEATYTFNPDAVGTYTIKFNASNSSGSVDCQYQIVVIKIRTKTDESSAYLTNLFEYKPAPGQFVNEGYGLMKDAEAILGKPKYGLVSLGGFGGYISLGFDHTLIDEEGDDFIVYGNAFKGSSEAGIVMVSFDYNGNGKADDAWFELAGSEYNKDEVIHNYEITYTNPKTYADVPWTDNQGNTGFVKINDWHEHNYYPEFIDEQDEITFTGTLLPNNKGTNDMGWIVYNEFEKGYVDNYSEEYAELKGNKFDISWAVNNKGEKVKLPGVDFIKVYTAVNIDGGILGEASTEIMGAADISLLEE